MIKSGPVRIFVNLKRFDIPMSRGGLCPTDDPAQWIEEVIAETVTLGLGRRDGLDLVYVLPESLLISARQAVDRHPPENRTGIQIGCQSVYRQDCSPGGNFGAFTANLPASAAAAAGASWAMVGHSEERRDKLGIISAFDPTTNSNPSAMARAAETVDTLVGDEVSCAMAAGLDVLLCVGETLEQRGDGTFSQQQPRIETTLRSQLRRGLGSMRDFPDRAVVIGYEPVWAIGPGKTPPDPPYVSFVARIIKQITQECAGVSLPVVYGGGLKRENAAGLGGVPELDGGLVALTKFTQPLAFEPVELDAIVQRFTDARGDSR
ncbi:MAG: triosephosphate isomerase [Spirochaetaceae bacterium]|nr:MAG: triosephosphate isomerase [Spirochaetaceae bacterium]